MAVEAHLRGLRQEVMMVEVLVVVVESQFQMGWQVNEGATSSIKARCRRRDPVERDLVSGRLPRCGLPPRASHLYRPEEPFALT